MAYRNAVVMVCKKCIICTLYKLRLILGQKMND